MKEVVSIEEGRNVRERMWQRNRLDERLKRQIALKKKERVVTNGGERKYESSSGSELLQQLGK